MRSMASKPSRTRASARAPLAPRRLDGLPRRAVTSVNVRHDDKALFDHLHTFWSWRRGRPLRQWDAFRLVLELAVENPRAQVPDEIRERR